MLFVYCLFLAELLLLLLFADALNKHRCWSSHKAKGCGKLSTLNGRRAPEIRCSRNALHLSYT